MSAPEFELAPKPPRSDSGVRAPAPSPPARQNDVSLAVATRPDPTTALEGLRREAEHRGEAGASGVSEPEVGPSSVSVPLRALVEAPAPLDARGLFAELEADPAPARATALAGRYVAGEYFAGKLDWPVQVELIQPGGDVWFEFTVAGRPVVATRTLELPLSALDSVSDEDLSSIVARATQIAEAAALDAAFPDVVQGIGAKPEKILLDQAAHARNEAVGMHVLVNAYQRRLDGLIASLHPANEWLRAVVAARRRELEPVLARVQRADEASNRFQNETMPSQTAGEVYDEAIQDDTGLSWFADWTWKLAGEVTTLGGQGELAQLARLYRRGEISLDDYNRNTWLAVGRVGVKAVAIALTAGRGSGLATRFLGLEGTAAAVVGAGAEGALGEFAPVFSSDVYSWVVSNVSGSPGVAAYQKRAIGGPMAWLTAAGTGGAMGAITGFATRRTTGAGGGAIEPTEPAAPRPLGPAKGAEVWTEVTSELGLSPPTVRQNWTIPGSWRSAKARAYERIFGTKTLPGINRRGSIQLTLGHIEEKATGGAHSLENLMPQLNEVNVQLAGIYARKPFRLVGPDGTVRVIASINGKPINGSLRDAFASGLFTLEEQRAISFYLTTMVVTPQLEARLAGLIGQVPGLAHLVP